MVCTFILKFLFFYINSGFATRAIHAGNKPDPIHGSVAPAIHMTSTYI
jgi:cystathionine gamma-synthase